MTTLVICLTVLASLGIVSWTVLRVLDQVREDEGLAEVKGHMAALSEQVGKVQELAQSADAKARQAANAASLRERR